MHPPHSSFDAADPSGYNGETDQERRGGEAAEIDGELREQKRTMRPLLPLLFLSSALVKVEHERAPADSKSPRTARRCFLSPFSKFCQPRIFGSSVNVRCQTCNVARTVQCSGRIERKKGLLRGKVQRQVTKTAQERQTLPHFLEPDHLENPVVWMPTTGTERRSVKRAVVAEERGERTYGNRASFQRSGSSSRRRTRA